MYYDFKVKIPEVKGKIYERTIKGVVYINYEYDRVYKPDKKYNIPKRTTIGKKCLDDPEMMYPNPTFLTYFPDAELPEDQGRETRSSCLHIGTWIVIEKLMTETLLDRIINGLYDDDRGTGLFLDLAAYYLTTENNAGQYYPDYAYNHPLFTPEHKIYSDSTVLTFISQISVEDSVSFQNEWNAYRAEWCFLLTLFHEEGPSDYVPYWVRYQYPHLENILHRRRLVPCGDSQCPYCSEQLSSTKQLKKWFGFDSFRSFNGEKIPLQQQVVESAMRGESLLAVFPTGGGKSMTFQLPALIAGTQVGALTVVISPIVALMKDQVDVLEKRRQIGDAAYINSMLSPAERKDVIEKVNNGEKNILYISPESLRSNTTFNILKHRRVERIVVDEAHCFSGWGHDFRVDYLYLADFLKDLQREKNLESPISVSCFTATAKQSVVDDICGYFKERLNLELVKFISPAKRTNLTYKVIESSESPNERRKQLVNVLREYNGPKIIYASKVKTTESLAEELYNRGFASACYNGKMESERLYRNLPLG